MSEAIPFIPMIANISPYMTYGYMIFMVLHTLTSRKITMERAVCRREVRSEAARRAFRVLQ